MIDANQFDNEVGLRAIACRRGAGGVVAVHRGDCDGLAIDDEMIDVFLEVGDRHGAGQARHRDHAVVVGDCDRVAVGRVDGNRVRLTIAAADRPRLRGRWRPASRRFRSDR